MRPPTLQPCALAGPSRYRAVPPCPAATTACRVRFRTPMLGSSSTGSTRAAPFSTCPRLFARHVDHYGALKLPRNASKQQIKARFYELSKKHHPDAPGGSPEQFHVINDAYATLGDAASRAAYDSSTRPASERGGGMGTPGSSSSFHPHSPQARAAAGPHRAWGGRPPPGAHYTGPKRQHGNLGHGMGMGSGPGSVPPGTRWGRKEGHGMGANARHRMNEGRLDEEVKGESVLWRSMVVFIVLVIIVGLGGGVSAKADVGEQGDDHVEVWREHCELEEEELD